MKRLALVALLLVGCAGEDVVRPDEVPEGGWWDVAGWHRFLDAWSHEAIAVIKQADPATLTPQEREALARGTLLQPAATPEAVKALEARVGRPLPPSYKAFLGASGGWIQLGMDATDGKLWPPEQVRWFREQEPGWLAAWSFGFNTDANDARYFVYGPKQDPVHLRPSYLKSALAISEGIEAAIYLLNPKVKSTGGEWEAWFFGNALPGANRYRSFQAMMMAERPRALGEIRAAHAPRRKP